MHKINKTIETNDKLENIVGKTKKLGENIFFNISNKSDISVIRKKIQVITTKLKVKNI
jgi:hypothetical protein